MHRALALLVWTFWVPHFMAAAQSGRPEKIEFYGVVRDAQAQPVADCQLTIAAPSPNRYSRFAATDFLVTGLHQFKTTTNSDGSFRFTVDATDPKWLGAGAGTITLQSASGLFNVTSYRLSRGLVDLPLDIHLPAHSRQQIRVVDPAGHALAGIKVSPTRYGDMLLPLAVSQDFQAVSDADGLVTLPGADQPLSGVIVADAAGNQQFLCPVDESAQTKRIVMRPLHVHQVRCQPPEDVVPTGIGRIEWVMFSYRGSLAQMEFAWQRVVTNNADPLEVRLPSGSFGAISDAHQGHGWQLSRDNVELTEEPANLQLKLERGLRVTGKVVDKQTGQPLGGIGLIHYLSDQPVQSGSDGTYEMWLPRLSDGTYPMDPLDEYFYSDAFFERPDAEHAPGEARIKPFELTRRPTTVGTVLGPDGQPAAGIKVICESKQERFTNNIELLSDRYGNFRFQNVSEGTPVKLTVMDRRGVTAEPVELTIAPDQSPVIRLVEPSPKRLLGRVVDADGQPVSGAVIEVQLGRVSIAEGFRAAEYAMEDAFAHAPRKRFTSNADGRFETDDIVDWQHVFSLKLTHPQHYETLSGLRHVERLPSDVRSFDFGNVTLRRVPEDQAFTIKTVDAAGAPLSGVKVVFIQGRDGAGQFITDENGSVTTKGKRTSAVVAARHGDTTAFSSFSEGEHEITLTLDAGQSPAKWHTTPGTVAERRAVASDLLVHFPLAKSMDAATLAKAPDGEVYGVLGAVVYANPTSVMRIATTLREELSKRQQVGMMLIQTAIDRNPELAPVLTPFLPSEYQGYVALTIMERAISASQREELLAEAIALAKKLDGDEAAVSVGRVAMELLHQGEVDLARELVSDLYESQKADFEGQSAARSKRGVARYFYPQLAIVDFDKSCELIRQHAYPNEIERLHSLALTLAVMSGKLDWVSGLKQLGRLSIGDTEKSLVPGAFGKTPLPNEQFVESLLGQVKDEKTRAMLCLYAATRVLKLSEDDQKKWLRRGVELLSQTSYDPPSHYTDALPYLLRENLARFGELDPVATRIIVFRSLEELTPFRDGQFYYLPDRVAAAAEAIAGLDTQLSRIMLEPFLNDLTWYQRTGANWQIFPLTVAARIDPAWASQHALRIINDPMREEKLRQVNVLSSLIDGLAGR